jgi:glycosyltransferase involved in cell wall biosynthesis
MDVKPRALLLSAYHAASHAAWADWLTASQPQFSWQRLELPGRHFRWRIRGNPLSWLDALPSRPPALIVATSMVDLATLKGLQLRMAAVPTLYYFHENQFAYPCQAGQFDSVDPQMVQLYGALAADSVVFNSTFNRDSFLEGIDALLNRLPDQLPTAVCRRVREKSAICPVPVVPITPTPKPVPALILWNHRWEYDKAPETFTSALLELDTRGVAFELALLGWRAEPPHPALQQLRDRLSSRIAIDGRVDRGTYRETLGRAAIVVSTSIHEFEGLAVLEAASGGARPLVPDGLCYAEQYPSMYRYPQGNPIALADRLQHWLEGAMPAPVDVSAWYESSLQPRWQRLLDDTLQLAHRPG